MEDGFEKEKKAIEADAKSKIEQLKQDGAKRGDVCIVTGKQIGRAHV